MPSKTRRKVSRRQALSTLLRATGVVAAPALLRAQAPLLVRFVAQRGLLSIPIDISPSTSWSAVASCSRRQRSWAPAKSRPPSPP